MPYNGDVYAFMRFIYESEKIDFFLLFFHPFQTND